MEKPYARVGEDGVQYNGPATAENDPPELKTEILKLAVFGPDADRAVQSSQITQLLKDTDATGQHFTLVSIPTGTSWGKASTALVQAVYQEHVLGIIALDRDSSHLAEQIGVKAFVPVIAISSDKMLTSTNIPWIFRLPATTGLSDAVQVFARAAKATSANRGQIREFLASGTPVAGIRFDSTGEMR